MASEKNLYQRILAVAADIRNVEKNLSEIGRAHV